MKLKMFQEAITWCDQGLAVSFDDIFKMSHLYRYSISTGQNELLEN